MSDVALVTANQPCCVCGSTHSEEFFTTQFKKFKSSSPFHMRKCSECGLLFCSPRLTPEGIAALYDAGYYVFKKADSAYFARTAEIYARTIGMLGRDTVPGRIAEVGSGKGYLLAALKGLGWSPFGIEICPEAAQYSRDVFQVPARAGELGAYLATREGEEPFPVVLGIDIIEHVLDPAVFAGELAQLTALGGHLIIDTPNADAAHIETEGANWRGFNPFHIFCFNVSNLSALLAKQGFEVVNAFSYNNVLDRSSAKQAPRKGVLQRLFDWRKPSSPSNLQECIAQCRRGGAYTETRDANAELAAGLRGENLIIIARKVR